jgi:hypothetical protein
MDSSSADDTNLVTSQVTTFQNQLQMIAGQTQSNIWLVLHYPFWVLEGKGTGIPTMYTAWSQANPQPDNISLVASGHKHLMETLDFKDGGVPQIVVGSGGTELTGSPSLGSGTSINGRIVDHVFVRDNFGYMAATLSNSVWTMQVMSDKGNVKATCTTSASSFVCQE